MIPPEPGTDELESILDERIERLEQAIRQLNRGQMEALGAAVEAQRNSTSPWPAALRYWFQGTGGLRLSPIEAQALRRLWTRLMVATTFALTGENAEAAGSDRTLGARLLRALGRSTSVQIEGRAATALERAMGGRVWTGFVGLWNASCAYLLSDHLSLELQQALEAPWRVAIGKTPRQALAEPGQMAKQSHGEVGASEL